MTLNAARILFLMNTRPSLMPAAATPRVVTRVLRSTTDMKKTSSSILHDRRLRSLVAGQMLPEDAQCSDRRNRDQGADDARHFSARQYCENLHQGRDLERLAHDARGVYIVLQQAPNAKKHQNPHQVRTTRENRDHDHNDGADGWAYHGNKFEDAGKWAENERVAQVQDAQDHGVGNHGEGSKC